MEKPFGLCWWHMVRIWAEKGPRSARGYEREHMTYIGAKATNPGAAPAKPVEPHITLRCEQRADGSRLNLWAYLDSAGRLHLDGQELGPVARAVSTDGEYEYFKMVAREDVPRLIGLLGGRPDEGILDLLERDWTGERSYQLEDILQEGPIEVELATWSG